MRYKLRNGDIVEVVTQQGHTPSRDWLTFTTSSRARSKIKHWIQIHQRERAIEIGRKLIEREARKYRLSLKDVSDEHYTRIATEFGVATANDLLAAIGYGRLGARNVLTKLKPESAQEIAPRPGEAEKSDSGISSVIRKIFQGDKGALKVVGQNDLLIYRAGCCNPIRGEDIVGFVTRGKGVSVHAKSCPNVQNLLYEPDRRIDVEWDKPAGDGPKSLISKPVYPVKLNVYSDDRTGILQTTDRGDRR